MENFESFELQSAELVFGGKLEPTYITDNGDFYDTETKLYIYID